VHFGMKWFRSNIKQGSRVALFALAIQFGLSFGHFHEIAAQAAPAIQSGSTQFEAQFEASCADRTAAPHAAGESARPRPASNHDSDQQPSDVCHICAVIGLANAVLFATPPLLLLPQAIRLSYLATDAELLRLNATRIAFQPRAPPLS
jgi:hypothetical protein